MTSSSQTVSALVNPTGSMTVLSTQEVSQLQDSSRTGLHSLFRQCALAVLSCDTELDDAQELLALYHDFDIKVIQEHRGLQLQLDNAPACAFVNGTLIRGVRENLFSVVRDILHLFSEIEARGLMNLSDPQDITNMVFEILRHANSFQKGSTPNIVVCWGGHSIGRAEYNYTKNVGYQLGLRGMNICTGCGPGAMKGPMKGAHIGHAKQRIRDGRFIGLTEPGIIAAESPNPIVNELIIMPDIEKRLEGFVRMGHGIIAFPGGPGTCEEIMYLIGILLHPDNRGLPFPFILTGPASSKEYFEHIDEFIGHTLGAEAQKLYTIVIDNPEQVANLMKQGLEEVTQYRKDHNDAFYYNWKLKIDTAFQHPFEPTHENMAALSLDTTLPAEELASNLRKAMSGIVAGNIKADGIQSIKERGKFQLHGEPELMKRIDTLLDGFVQQQRMKLPGTHYKPCYEVIC
ncbi:nucleotide 5'-monophosphate nucleosidase PpnN [Sansalvadorimonas verongulae]|uniref:nucleotide 5'-monophosphate nucleosidase PpnN n=1 Tax=Sansalvadorimonas verongulae TaxID=2172824 RepID=UPI0012BD1625|nr:nucleotide 5'-monophosphate nucleosidase PpnN [Sansalvadorimonas verongulae]MTI13880.1 LOG family protein [Sansalvadorimonas verongulae]